MARRCVARWSGVQGGSHVYRWRRRSHHSDYHPAPAAPVMQVAERSTGGRRIQAAASKIALAGVSPFETLQRPIAVPTHAELAAIYDTVGEVEGWDFRGAEPVPETEPWDWDLQVRAACLPTSRVLDIGTGGGEVFRE